MEVTIDAEKFFSRLSTLQNKWLSAKSGQFAGADALVIPMGTANDDELTYSKSAAVHLYLLGYEFSDSLLVLTKNMLYFMATTKKCGYLSAATAKHPNSEIQVQFLTKSKDDVANQEQFSIILNALKKQGASKLGSFLKADYKGSFVPLWSSTVAETKLELVDISNGLGIALAAKDDEELVFELIITLSGCLTIFSS